ncbi:MAG: LAGLIDADG family homing endonuclease, partial [Nanoarchaeota archaeon]
IIRAKHDVYVNKDGTIRYDMSELPITHFKPVEVGTTVERLKELGYQKDVYGNELTDPEQVLEIFPQDIILPAATDALDEPCDNVLFRTTLFIDEILERIYKLPPYYNLKKKSELVGHLTICLAPHISAGMVGRIIGFSKTQGFFTHPLFHAALRRDCFSYDTLLPIYDGKEWKNQKIGALVKKLNPQIVVDSFGTKEVKVYGYKTIGIDKNGKIAVVYINNFTKHNPTQMIRIKTRAGREITTTANHKFLVKEEKEEKIKIKTAEMVKKGQKLILPKRVPLPIKKIKEINFINIFKGRNDIMVSGVRDTLKKFISKSQKEISNAIGFKYRDVRNFFFRNSFPLLVLEKICGAYKININIVTKNAKLSAKRDNVKLPIIIKCDEEFMEYLGLYVAEGYSRYIKGKKGCAQVYVAAFDKEIRKKVLSFGKKIGLKQSENKKDRITFCSRVWYEFIAKILGCGSTAYEKRAPHFLFEADATLIGAFLRGYFEGDGSVSVSDIRVACDSVSKKLLSDLHLLLLKIGIFSRFYEYKKKPGPLLREFYKKKGKIPVFAITKLTIPSNYVSVFRKKVGFITKRKKNILAAFINRKPTGMRLEHDSLYVYDEVSEVHICKDQESYCLNVQGNVVLANGILTRQCDGDEASVTLLMDGLLNFSRRYLPARIGARTMD